MSKRIKKHAPLGGKFYRNIPLFSALIAATALSGCVSLDRQTAGNYLVDQFSTASTNTVAQSNLNQALPNALPSSLPEVGGSLMQTASALPKYLPPASIGNIIKTQNATHVGTRLDTINKVTSSNLPALAPVKPTPVKPTQNLGNTSIMPAQTATINTNPISVAPVAVVAPIVKPNLENAYIHKVESGESLYSIARKYNVSVNAIVAANSMISADKLGVGQKIGIPGRPDLIAKKASPQVALLKPNTKKPPVVNVATKPVKTAPTPAPVPAPQPVIEKITPVKLASTAPTATVTPEKFIWPVSGKLITSFAASKGTGINIQVPNGTPVKSVAKGTVIYVGTAVQNYGNLILVKHENGFVSAYAHLDKSVVTKGDVIDRGKTIGYAGQTGSVTSSQLHFELRKGATPVDPVPMLAS